MPPRIHIIGHKNSGKTTLIAELVEHLKAKGMRVGTIKHTHHHHELDTPGKDSHRHREAGAAVVGILAREMSAVFWPATGDQAKSARYAAMMAAFADCDVVLVEGDSRTDAPKIEIWRAATQNGPIALADASVLAVVTDDPLEITTPIRGRSDVGPLAAWMVDGFVGRE